jgi:hypothetical protein
MFKLSFCAGDGTTGPGKAPKKAAPMKIWGKVVSVDVAAAAPEKTD